MSRYIFKFLFSIISTVLILTSCKESQEKDLTDTQLLVGKWSYLKTQILEDNQWIDLPNQLEINSYTSFDEFGNGFISMIYNGETHSQSFKWTLHSNGIYEIDGTVRGNISFEGQNRFYLYTKETIDLSTGNTIYGSFRDIYNRKTE